MQEIYYNFVFYLNRSHFVLILIKRITCSISSDSDLKKVIIFIIKDNDETIFTSFFVGLRL